MRNERGIAVPIVLMVLLVTTLLGSAAVIAAVRSNNLTNRDTRSKAALEAADAGVRTAAYRMNMLGTRDPYCPTAPTAVAWDAVSRMCQRDGPSQDDARWGDSAPDDASSHLGNGATFSYWVSAPLRTGDACAGDTVQNTLFPVSQRCVTAVGTANGVSARTQARVAAYSAKPLFGGAGLIGANRLSIKPGNGGQVAGIFGTVGSNKQITLGNNVTVDGTTQSGVAAELGPAATMTTSNGDILLPSNQPAVVDPAQLNIAPVDPGCSSGGVGTAPAGGGCWNIDNRIAGCTASGSATVDGCSGLTWTAASRSVNIANGGNVTLNGGTLPYNFCNFTTQNNTTINIPLGAHVVIFIDSPSADGGDPNGNCPSGSGNFTLGNGTIIRNLNTDPLTLQIYIYGTTTPKGANVVTWNNNALSTYATLYAPNSTVQLQNNGGFWGAVGAYNLDITNNFTYRWVNTISQLSARPQGLYYRSAWKQCPTQPTTADPRSGC
jgi:hypothetical protein